MGFTPKSMCGVAVYTPPSSLADRYLPPIHSRLQPPFLYTTRPHLAIAPQLPRCRSHHVIALTSLSPARYTSIVPSSRPRSGSRTKRSKNNIIAAIEFKEPAVTNVIRYQDRADTSSKAAYYTRGVNRVNKAVYYTRGVNRISILLLIRFLSTI